MKLNTNESFVISGKKINNQNSNKSLNNDQIFNDGNRAITPMQITDISNNKIINGNNKYISVIGQLNYENHFLNEYVLIYFKYVNNYFKFFYFFFYF